MDQQLIRHAKNAEDVAAGLQVFLDRVPQHATDISAIISELFATSSAIRALHTASDDVRYARAFYTIRSDLDLVLCSLQYTLGTVRGIFARTGLASYRALWDGLNLFVQTEGPSLCTRLEWYRVFLHDLFDVLRSISTDRLIVFRERIKRLLIRQESPETHVPNLSADAEVSELPIKSQNVTAETSRERGKDWSQPASCKSSKRMVLFYCTFVAMKRQDAVPILPHLEDIFQLREEEEFAGKIQDDSYLHALRLFRDPLSGGVRLEGSALRGPMKNTPIWTAFVTLHLVSRSWLQWVESKVIWLKDLKPYVFCEGYSPPRARTGEFELRFTTRDDSEGAEAAVMLSMDYAQRQVSGE
ncbi:hypothetical protein LTR28_004014 [Elasticomyces elasticus]|nr:hypothetical protein LTR28_004014 [Elasticomyces elasticus]